MAFMRIVHARTTFNAALYDAVAGEVHVTTDHPLGLIMHAAGEIGGEWQIVEVWEEKEHADQFDRERLRPAFEAVTGGRAELSPTDSCELHQLVTP